MILLRVKAKSLLCYWAVRDLGIRENIGVTSSFLTEVKNEDVTLMFPFEVKNEDVTPMFPYEAILKALGVFDRYSFTMDRFICCGDSVCRVRFEKRKE